MPARIIQLYIYIPVSMGAIQYYKLSMLIVTATEVILTVKVI